MMSDEARIQRDEQFPFNLIPYAATIALAGVIAGGSFFGLYKVMEKDLRINYENIDPNEDYRFDTTRDYDSLNITRSGDIHDFTVKNAVRIVTFKQNGIEATRLLEVMKVGRETAPFYSAEYKDLETGVTVKVIEDGQCIFGEDVEIINEEKASDYLDLLDNNKNKYDINELIEFYHEEMLPLYEEKQLVKQTASNTK